MIAVVIYIIMLTSLLYDIFVPSHLKFINNSVAWEGGCGIFEMSSGFEVQTVGKSEQLVL